jgi:hypothetical protein
MHSLKPSARPGPPQPNRAEVEASGGDRVGHHHDFRALAPQGCTDLGDMARDTAGTNAEHHDDLHRALLASLVATSRADSGSPTQTVAAHNVTTAMVTSNATVAPAATP